MTVIRYEHPAPGDLLHLDIKHLGRFTEIAVRPDGRRRGKHHRGWEYLHVAVDDHSCIAFSQILPNFTGVSATAFLRASVAYYATLGIPIRRVLTDNGHCCRSGAFRNVCPELGIIHRFTRPYTPRTNGKAERFIHRTSRMGLCPQLFHLRNNELLNYPHGSITTAGTGHMVVSITLHRSAAPAWNTTTC